MILRMSRQFSKYDPVDNEPRDPDEYKRSDDCRLDGIFHNFLAESIWTYLNLVTASRYAQPLSRCV